MNGDIGFDVAQSAVAVYYLGSTLRKRWLPHIFQPPDGDGTQRKRRHDALSAASDLGARR